MEANATKSQQYAELARALIKVLGLPQNVTKLTLTMAAGKPPLVECECHPDVASDAVSELAAMGWRFELVPVAEGIGGA